MICARKGMEVAQWAKDKANFNAIWVISPNSVLCLGEGCTLWQETGWPHCEHPVWGKPQLETGMANKAIMRPSYLLLFLISPKLDYSGSSRQWCTDVRVSPTSYLVLGGPRCCAWLGPLTTAYCKWCGPIQQGGPPAGTMRWGEPCKESAELGLAPSKAGLGQGNFRCLKVQRS